MSSKAHNESGLESQMKPSDPDPSIKYQNIRLNCSFLWTIRSFFSLNCHPITMKKNILIAVFVIAGFYALLYFWNQDRKSEIQHPTINNAAAKPDDFLIEAKNYEEMARHDKSAYSIEQAIQAIWKLENDVNDESFERLEQTITKLEIVHRKILRDSIPSEELLKSFEYALGNLAHAELEVAEQYFKSNQTEKTKSALRYAQLHIKNALLLHHTDDSAKQTELHLLKEMDSLFSLKNLSDPANTASLDKILKEVDQLIEQIDQE